MASGSFKCHFSALMWLHDTLKISSGPKEKEKKKKKKKKKKEKQKEFINHVEYTYSDVLVECEWLA